jgi:fatty-acyl-CoA synthase
LPCTGAATRRQGHGTRHPYASGLDKNAANHVALSPLSFLERVRLRLPRPGGHRLRWACARPGRTTYERCRRLASALTRRGVGVGDTVAVMLPNTPAMFEAHFGVPMTGAVLNTLNTRLDAEAIAFMLQHGEAKVLLTDREFAPVVGKGAGDAWASAARW